MIDTTFGRKSAAGLALAALLVAGGASAQDVDVPGFQRLTGSVSQDFSLRDNFNFSGGGFDWNTTSRLSLTFRAENNRAQFSASTGTGFRLTSNGNFSIFEPNLALRYATGTRRFNITATGNYSLREINFDEIQPDLSTLTIGGEREQLRANITVNTAVNRSTSVAVSANYGTLQFEPSSPALIESNSFGINSTLNHQVTQRTRVSLNGGLSFFAPDTGLDSITTSAGAGLNHAFNRSTTVNANFGVALSETDLAGGGSRSDGNFTYGLGVNRQLPSGSISASINQQVVPTAAGTLQVNTGLRAGYSERINQRERFGLNASFDIQENLTGSGSSTFFSVTPNYSVQLGRDLAANAAYSLQRNDAGDIAQSLNLSLSRDFNLPF